MVKAGFLIYTLFRADNIMLPEFLSDTSLIRSKYFYPINRQGAGSNFNRIQVVEKGAMKIGITPMIPATGVLCPKSTW